MIRSGYDMPAINITLYLYLSLIKRSMLHPSYTIVRKKTFDKTKGVYYKQVYTLGQNVRRRVVDVRH